MHTDSQSRLTIACSASMRWKYASTASLTGARVSVEPCSWHRGGRGRGSQRSALTPDNDAMMGLDPAPRAPIELPAYYKSNKDGQILCKAHGNTSCKSCCASASSYIQKCRVLMIVGWKKQITKLHKEGKKAAKGKKESGTNLY